MLENVALAIQGVVSHKLRSFLTMLGIIIGIASIITIVSTIKGTNEQIKQNLIGAGDNVATLRLNQNDHAYELEYSAIPDGIGSLSESDKEELDKIDGVVKTSTYFTREWADGVYYKNNPFNGKLRGVDGRYLEVYDYALSAGRKFSASDYEKIRKVAIVDDKASKNLFMGDEPIGNTIEIQNEPFTVIGVISSRQSEGPVINSVDDYYMYGESSSGTVLIPDVCWSIAYRYDEPSLIAVKAKATDDMTSAGNDVAEEVNSRIVNSADFAYKADNLLEQAESIQSLSETTNRQLIWIAGISLLVGGIGVMNIMLVSVTERTKEIGLKLAIGARQKRILWQFLTEAAVLTSLGGIIGVGSGIGLAYLLANVMGTPVAISIPACVIALVFSTVIGIVFGLVPALKASKLNPIDALRYE